MLSQREIAEKKRDKDDLEAKRESLKLALQMHRDKGEVVTAEENEASKRDLQAYADTEAQIRALDEELKAAPEPNKEVGGMTRTMNIAEINKSNYRSTPEYRDAYYRSMMAGRIAAEDLPLMEHGKRAVTDMNGLSVTSGAGYLVPLSTLDTIQSIITKYGPVYAAVTKYRFNGDVSLPIGTEDTTVNESDGTDTLAFIFTEAKLVQMAVIATVPIKNLLLKNSIAGFEMYIAMEIGKYIGLQCENYVINGNTTAWQGITHETGTTGTYSEMDWETVAAILGAVESPYGDNGTWIMRRSTFFSKFFAMTDAEGRPLINTIPGISGQPGSVNYVIGGRPVIFSSKVAANAVLFGDLSMFILNESQELIIESDASAGFTADKTIWRGKVYSGGKLMFGTTTFAYYTYVAA